MKLTYRGVSYDYSPPEVEMTDGRVVGKYRGLEWRFRNPKKAPVLSTNLDLKYRGASYRPANLAPQVHTGTVTPTTGVTAASPNPAKASTLFTEERARSLMMSRHRANANRQQSMLSRAAAEVGIVLSAPRTRSH